MVPFPKCVWLVPEDGVVPLEGKGCWGGAPWGGNCRFPYFCLVFSPLFCPFAHTNTCVIFMDYARTWSREVRSNV